MFKVPEKYRVKTGVYGSNRTYENNGAFNIECYSGPKKNVLFCLASDGAGWEHVSVTVDEKRTPSWEEMCIIKDTFWGSKDLVQQFHPPKEKYVNYHEYCLHLWRPIGCKVFSPPMILIGPKKR